MLKKAIEVLKTLEDKGYSSYIVGGYVRDLLLKRKTNDIDICTVATPKQVMELFEVENSNELQYGSVRVLYKGIKLDVTTFRKEIKYEENRKPVKIKYIESLKKDLLRRDFTINTLCMDSNEKIIDLLKAKEDVSNKIVKTVGNPRNKLKEDSLRILRAVRFACVLDFEIDSKTKYFITKYGNLLTNLSSTRKKEELDKIFSSKNKERGRNLLLSLKLNKHLKLDNLNEIVMCDCLVGTWTQLNVDDIYPFTKLEREQMKKIRELLTKDLFDEYIIYKYGLYLVMVAAQINEIDCKKITQKYNKLQIYTKQEINFKITDISEILKIKPGSKTKNIMSEIEEKIVYNQLKNDYEEIKKYILENYQ